MDCCSPKGPKGVDADDLTTGPQSAPAPQDRHEAGCNGCGRASRPVARKTVLLMLKPELLDRVVEGDYRFCAEPDCPVVYSAKGGRATFMTDDLRVRVGLKEKADPVPLCYCFGFEERDARDEIARTGTSAIPQRITALIKGGMCACEARNPSGACCLGEVNRAIKRLKEEAAVVTSQPA